MSDPTPDAEFGILQRRRIEARILAPVYRILKRDYGIDKAREIIGEAIIQDAIAQGADFAAREGGKANMVTFIAIQDLWTRDDALETETIDSSPSAYSYDVTRCRYAEMYREEGLAEIGDLLSCARDEEFIKGYHPGIALQRTTTIMAGDDRCRFRYRLLEGDPAQAGPETPTP